MFHLKYHQNWPVNPPRQIVKNPPINHQQYIPSRRRPFLWLKIRPILRPWLLESQYGSIKHSQKYREKLHPRRFPNKLLLCSIWWTRMKERLLWQIIRAHCHVIKEKNFTIYFFRFLNSVRHISNHKMNLRNDSITYFYYLLSL